MSIDLTSSQLFRMYSVVVIFVLFLLIMLYSYWSSVDKKNSNDKSYDDLKIEADSLQELVLTLQDELDKTKKALRDTADGRPSEWAYVQLKNSFDDLEKANGVLRGLVIAAVDRSDALADALSVALKKYRSNI